uniref:Uncharacterized protein n=1 Tax=Amazona collaria TaxID=241587 RepID=A0A8B9FGA4_9PSIT
MKKPNKTSDSLQDELIDCIKVQEAKEQEPGGCSVKVEEEWIQDRNIEGESGLACEHTLEMTSNCCYNKGHCKEEQSEVAVSSDKSFSLLAAEPIDSYSLTVAETSPNSYRKEQKSQIKHFKGEEESVNEELKYEKEAPKWKRKKSSEGADLGKANEKLNEKQKRMKVGMGLVSKKKSRPYKDKIQENPADKTSKNPKEDKEKPQREGQNRRGTTLG